MPLQLYDNCCNPGNDHRNESSCSYSDRKRGSIVFSCCSAGVSRLHHSLSRRHIGPEVDRVISQRLREGGHAFEDGEGMMAAPALSGPRLSVIPNGKRALRGTKTRRNAVLSVAYKRRVLASPTPRTR